jgi:hypothetical protein
MCSAKRILTTILLVLFLTAPVSAEIVTATGTIEAVDAAARAITVRRKTTKGEKTAKFAVGPKAAITIDDQPRDLASLKAGQDATITYDRTAKQVTGISVRLASAPSAGDRVAPGADPPGDATAFEGHSYKFYREVMTWHQAKRRCEELGGHLAVVGSDAENGFIMALAKSGIGNVGQWDGVWLGATDEAKEGDWRWNDGAKVSFSKWAPNQPNNGQNSEHYLLLWLLREVWVDQPDRSKHHVAYFVCEWDAAWPLVPAADATPSAAVPAFSAIFNGKNLDGWDGDPKFWSVADGTIVGRTTAAKRAAKNTCLIWRQGTVGDFELRLSWKLESGNSGIQYRSTDLGGHVVAGYQADMDADGKYVGALFEEGGRGMLAQCGQKTVIGSDHKPTVMDYIAERTRLQATVAKSDWNKYTILARGNHLRHFVNDELVIEVTDSDDEQRTLSGVLALQIHTGAPMTVRFKDIRLKQFTQSR